MSKIYSYLDPYKNYRNSTYDNKSIEMDLPGKSNSYKKSLKHNESLLFVLYESIIIDIYYYVLSSKWR